MNGIARLLVASGVFVSCMAAAQPHALDALAEQSAPRYVFTTLEVPASTHTDAWDINKDGIIVGHYVSTDGATHGFVRTGSGSYFTLDVPGAVFTQATTINDRGDVAGTYRLPAEAVLRAFLRTADGDFAAIDVPGASSTLPRGSNKHGEIVFEAVVDGHTTAYLLSEGVFWNIEPCAMFAGAAVTFSYASGINKHQAIVGRYDTAAFGARGYLLDAAGRSHCSDAYTTLHFPGATSSAALGIDKRGVIVGGYTKDAVRHGYLLIDDTYFTLDVPGCSASVIGGAMTCTTPRKVNDAGQIVGFYGAGGTSVRGFLASPE